MAEMLKPVPSHPMGWADTVILKPQKCVHGLEGDLVWCSQCNISYTNISSANFIDTKAGENYDQSYKEHYEAKEVSATKGGFVPIRRTDLCFK
jgi:hypothetical protein